MAKILITGGTGLIGTALTRAAVARGHEVTILSRRPITGREPHITYASWNVERQVIDEEAIKQADFIVHLAGANVAAGRWTRERKKEILDSRVNSAALLVKALREIPNKVSAVLSSSAIGYYGPDPVVPNPHPFVESDSPARDFLATVVRQWEQAIRAVTGLQKRLVIFRTGIVLSQEGGALPEFRKPLRFGLATVLGNGRQVVSWIHIDDLTRLYLEAIENTTWQGVYNAVAPQPVTNKAMVLAIAQQSSHPYLPLYVPAFVLRTMLGEMSVEVLKSATVSGARLREQGFGFLYSSVSAAVKKPEAS